MPVVGQSALSWWRVKVWSIVPIKTVEGQPIPSRTAVYEVKALDDNMAARDGLRRFEREHVALMN